MIGALLIYCGRLTQVFAAGWRNFWFTPAHPWPLAMLRIVAGLASLDYLIAWAPDLQYWFGPNGVLPATSVRQLLGLTDSAGDYYGLSYLNVVQIPWLLNAVHAMAVVVAIAYTLGVYTRIANLLLWLVLLSYVHRAPLLTTQLDPLLTMVVGYLCLAPSGACWSWDAWRKRSDSPPDSETGDEGVQFIARTEVDESVFANLAQRLLQVHITAFYLLFALNKLGGATWWSGEAAWWLIAQPDSPLLDLQSLERTPNAIYVWTHAIVAIELLYPWLIWNRWSRPVAMLLASVSWVSVALLTGRLTFCLLMIGLQFAFFQGTTPFPPLDSSPDDGLPE